MIDNIFSTKVFPCIVIDMKNYKIYKNVIPRDKIDKFLNSHSQFKRAKCNIIRDKPIQKPPFVGFFISIKKLNNV